MAGVKIPLIPWKHAYIVTERIEGIQNMPNCRDHDASLYLKLQGDGLCVGGYEPNPVFLENDRVSRRPLINKDTNTNFITLTMYR